MVKKYKQAKQVLITGLALAKKEGNSRLIKSLNRLFGKLPLSVNWFIQDQNQWKLSVIRAKYATCHKDNCFDGF